MKRVTAASLSILLAILLAGVRLATATESGDAEQLVAAMLGKTPLIEDLRSLTDEIGGRPTGSEANRRSVVWALDRFRDAGVEAQREPFPMPARWLERSALAEVRGDVRFRARVAAMPFSTATPPAGISAALVDAGRGDEADFERLGERARDAFVLIETDELQDITGLFAEYASASEIEPRAVARGAAGVVYVGSRSRDVLYRHNASAGPDTDRPMLVMERDAALRALRLIRDGKALELWVKLDLERGQGYESENVIGEIRGSENPEEIVVIGAHLDSWDIGTGALDNGCNVALVIDVARQIARLGLRPRRTIRFALFNGEEQGMHGSWGYVMTHRAELDRHVVASSYDIGSGRITGFFTGGRPVLLEKVASTLEPVRGLGPFENIDEAIVGTDNYDFMMEGVANLVANQESANYGPNYHARTDTFGAVDQHQLRLNAAIAAAVTWGFAEMEFDWPRQSREQLEALIAGSDLAAQMRGMGLWEPWQRGERGRAR